jgi:hypothetical protein
MRMLLKILSQHTPVRTAFHHPGSNRIQINLSIIMIGFRHLQIYQPLSDSSLFYVYSLMDKFRLDRGCKELKKSSSSISEIGKQRFTVKNNGQKEGEDVAHRINDEHPIHFTL